MDSEVMIGLLNQKDFMVTSQEEKADFIVINTCCFIKDALQESIDTILEAAQYKKTGCCKGIIVTGCLGQRYEKEIFEQLPEVDAIVGTSAYEDIVEVIERLIDGETCVKHLDSIDRAMEEKNSQLRIPSTPAYFAYLKIAEGCDNFCTYCVIPKMRGKYRSRHMESLIEEAKKLAEGGVKELILIAQDVAYYGQDLYGKNMLAQLLKELCAIDGLEWIRLLYCYPEHLTDDAIAVIASEPKICHYIDMPIQHANNQVLKRMGRRSSQELLKNIVGKLRKAMPDIAIRTTIITGFPQESDDEFLDMLSFVETTGFDRLGVFTYSQEEGTPAAKMNGQIEEDLKEKRKDILMEAQKRISAEKCEQMLGKRLKVLVEGYLPEEKVYCARSYKDTPDIDGLVFINFQGQLLSGDFITVEITEASDYDLIGEVVEDGIESCQ